MINNILTFYTTDDSDTLDSINVVAETYEEPIESISEPKPIEIIENSIQGPIGPQGEQGPQGIPGVDGRIPGW